MASSSLPTQLAETVQTAHIQRHPDPRRDINPSTAASKREPVAATPSQKRDDSDVESEIPLSVLRPWPRSHSFPPMPDLRFEQSYLHSIQKADTWWKVLWITVRDQMMMPFTQGIIYNVGIMGWQHWNRNAQFSGSSVGATLRRWWYNVNGWPIPKKTKAS